METRTSKRERYPTDLTDKEWAKIAPMIPAVLPGGRPAKYERREILNAIFYLLKGGSSWRMMPHDLPPWKIVYTYFAIWRDEALFERINDVLRRQVRIQAGRDPEPSAAIMDSQSVKTTQKGGPTRPTGSTGSTGSSGATRRMDKARRAALATMQASRSKEESGISW
jgi:transposase